MKKRGVDSNEKDCIKKASRVQNMSKVCKMKVWQVNCWLSFSYSCAVLHCTQSGPTAAKMGTARTEQCVHAVISMAMVLAHSPHRRERCSSAHLATRTG